jgi:hypothetical protein
MKSLLLFILTLGLVACGDSHIVNDPKSNIAPLSESCSMFFVTEGLCLRSDWEAMPTSETMGSMILTFTDQTNPYHRVSPKSEPFVVLWMTSMGHGSSPVSIESIEPGRFRVKDVFFIMPGPWDIKYQLRDGSQVVEEVAREIIIP